MEKYIKDLEWRYAVKKFDQSKTLSPEDLEKLLKSVQLSASSYGLQPYEIFVIEDPQVRQKLKAAAWGQSQITDASQLIVFAGLNTISEKHIEAYMENVSKIRDIQIEKLNSFKEKLHEAVLTKSPKEQRSWSAKQCYIALGNLLSAAANFNIDTCPMEGFNAEEFDKILGLKEKGLTTAVIATIGYRSKDDVAQHAKKVRKSREQLYHHI